MHGSFNGVRLRKIVTRKITGLNSGTVHTTLRALTKPIPALEEQLRLNGPALLILSAETIEGRIVHFVADLPGGAYEITIESKE